MSTRGSIKFKRDLDREAVNLALNGEWDRATEVNKAILELFPSDVDAMNRLVKALIEVGSYVDARAVLNQVSEVAPYNNIAKKNLARLDHLVENPDLANTGTARSDRKSPAQPQTFIEESGKSATTVVRNSRGSNSRFHVSPSDPVVLFRDKNTIDIRTLDGEVLGQVEPKMGNRLARLIGGGNKYSAAVLAISEDGVSIMIRETFKHPSLHNTVSFPTQSPSDTDGNRRTLLTERVARLVLEEDDEEENVIDEGALEASWSEDE